MKFSGAVNHISTNNPELFHASYNSKKKENEYEKKFFRCVP